MIDGWLAGKKIRDTVARLWAASVQKQRVKIWMPVNYAIRFSPPPFRVMIP
jgi:hypothetical protein